MLVLMVPQYSSCELNCVFVLVIFQVFLGASDSQSKAQTDCLPKYNNFVTVSSPTHKEFCLCVCVALEYGLMLVGQYLVVVNDNLTVSYSSYNRTEKVKTYRIITLKSHILDVTLCMYLCVWL